MNACLPFSLLALATGLAAQPAFTMPRNYDATEGDGTSRLFGVMSEFRSMMMERLRGQRFMLRETAFRADYRNYAVDPVVGRSWRTVTLRMGEADALANTSRFSGKLRTPQTTVFSGSVALPARNRLPASRPVPFSIRFPFRAPWAYSGRWDLAADYEFRGGQLASGHGWAGLIVPYHLDLAQNLGTPHPSAAPGVVLTANTCTDSGRGRSATLTTYQSLYHPLTSGDTDVRVSTQDTAGARVLMLLGLAGSTAGTVFPGVRCQRLFVDLMQPTVLTLVPTNPTGEANLTLRAPYRPSFGGRTLWIQAAWSDSRTGRAKLTSGSLQGLYRPLSDNTHLEMYGVGADTGILHRQGGPICRYQQ